MSADTGKSKDSRKTDVDGSDSIRTCSRYGCILRYHQPHRSGISGGTGVLDRRKHYGAGNSRHHTVRTPGIRGILLTGGFSGTDLYTPAMLLRFVRDYAEYLSAGKRIYSVSLPYLYASRTIHVVPMLNPDGYAIRRVGVSDIPIADRLIRQNGGGDFSSWRYNARGVNLTENFVNREDKRTEREPETESLCRYIRMAQNGVIGKIEMAVELHADSSAIRYFSGEKTAPRSKTIARLLARMTGCRMDPGEGMREEGGSLTDYFLQTVGCPAFSCGCLDAGGEKCASVEEEYLRMYAAFREALFSAALLL